MDTAGDGGGWAPVLGPVLHNSAVSHELLGPLVRDTALAVTQRVLTFLV